MSRAPKHAVPNIRLLLNGVGALGLLWILLLWSSVERSAQNTNVYQQPMVGVTADALAFISSEQQLVLRANGSTFSSSPQPDQSTPLIAALFFVALAIFLLRKKTSSRCLDISITAHRFQLQTLNISRAPPLSL